MAINGIRPIGDDQEWKREVEATISDLAKQIAELARIVRYISESR